MCPGFVASGRCIKPIAPPSILPPSCRPLGDWLLTPCLGGAVMAGANVAMMTSELLANGKVRITEIVTDLDEWMRKHEYESIAQMRAA